MAIIRHNATHADHSVTWAFEHSLGIRHLRRDTLPAPTICDSLVTGHQHLTECERLIPGSSPVTHHSSLFFKQHKRPGVHTVPISVGKLTSIVAPQPSGDGGLDCATIGATVGGNCYTSIRGTQAFSAPQIKNQKSKIKNQKSKIPQVIRTTPQLIAARFLLKPGRRYEAAVKAFQPYDKIQEINEDARTAAANLILEGVASDPRASTSLPAANRGGEGTGRGG